MDQKQLEKDRKTLSYVLPLVRFYARCSCKFTTEPIYPKEQFILVSNHLTERDAFIAANAVRAHMYFIGSEHLTRRTDFIKKIIDLANPIYRAKGARDVSSMKEMLDRTKAGANLLLYPEGHRSADGVSKPITPALGKLIKRSGCTLITMKITGGYFSEPRWASNVRKGPMTAGVVGTYSPEELAKLTNEEVAELVNRDIYEDAYERQRQNPVAYKGKRLAEGLDNHLFCCPSCHGISTLHTEDNRLWCDCGISAIYDEYAWLKGDFAFDNVRDWSNWQVAHFEEMYAAGDISFTDDGATLYLITPDHVQSVVTTGTITADKETLTIGERSFTFASMFSAAFMNQGNTLYFETPEGYFQLYGKGICQMKYYLLWRALHPSSPVL